MLNVCLQALEMDCTVPKRSRIDGNVEEGVQEDKEKGQITKKIKPLKNYIDSVLTESRDNCQERLNLVMYPSSSVQAQPIDTSATAGITAAWKFNQWFVVATLCNLNVTERFHLPKQILLNLLHRVLQTHDNGELSEIMIILRKHIFLHPPRYPEQHRKLYTSLLMEDCREMLHGSSTLTDGFVVQMLNHLEQICRSEEVDSDSETINASTKDANKEEQDIVQLPLHELVHSMESRQVYNELSPDDKLTRLGLVLDFSIIVLEQDFLAWHGSCPRWSRLHKTLHKHQERPLIVALAWPRAAHMQIGMCNTFCRRVTQMIWADKLQGPLLRLLTLLAEVMSISESKGRFPVMGEKCCTLAREVSLGMSQSAEGLVQQACQLKPDWLALLVIHQAITKVVRPGNVGMPSLDLIEACMALVDHGPAMQSEVEPDVEMDLDLAESPGKINKRYKTGETRLHIACKKGNVAEIKKLLQQPHIDVNIADNMGWTPLHEAVVGGRESVETMLRYRSASGMSVNVRAKNHEGITPLMDAVIRGRADVCDLLLKNSGWCLLEDSRVDGLKAEDLALSPEIKAILAASRLGKRSLMFKYLSCVDVPALNTFLPVYLKLYLSVYKLHLVALKIMRGETPSSNVVKADSKLFDFVEISRSLKVLESIHKAAVRGSQIDGILKGRV